MVKISENYSILFKRLLFALVLMTLGRMLFYLYNFNFFSDISFLHVLRSLFVGIRFDISALVYINVLVIALHLLPMPYFANKKYQKVLKIIFIFSNSVALFANIADALFFIFQGKRTTAEIFSSQWLGGDFIRLIPKLLLDFWYAVILVVVMVWAISKYYPRFKTDENAPSNKKTQIAVYIAMLLITIGGCVIGARGGTQLRPITNITAAQYISAKNIAFIQNTPFTIIQTLVLEKMPRLDYYPEDKLKKIYTPIQKYNNNKFRKRNVVIIIMESFGKEYIGSLNDYPGYTPFLDSLIKKSLVFPEAYANGKRSIEALPAILSGIPSFYNDPYITSGYSDNEVESIASKLNKQGYLTAMFHGGHNGTMGFDQFAKIAGYKKYIGKNEYNGPAEGFDGAWGVYDEEFLQFMKQQLDTYQTPFMATVFTLSSHHPYNIPEKHAGKFPKGNLINHESIGYSDYALGQFFKAARQSKWFKNTLFIITADHTAQSEYPKYSNSQGMFRVPIIIYAPYNPSLKGVNTRVVQQADIYPTIIDLLGIKDPILAFGHSITDPLHNNEAISHSGGIYSYMNKKYTLIFNDTTATALFEYKKDSLLNNNLINDSVVAKDILTKRVKAIIQSYNNRLLDNDLMPVSQSKKKTSPTTDKKQR